MSRTPSPHQSLALYLRTLKLPSFAAHHEEVARRAEKEGWSFGQYLRHLAELEVAERRTRRIERALKESQLPKEKLLSTLELGRLPVKVKRALPALCEGGFIERAENLLLFGLPGTGKTHLACAIGHELIRRGWRVLFVPAGHLVQRLLVAKRELRLERQLRDLDAFDALILDDIGYIQQDREEMEVLFTCLAERYERKSVVITSNLVFSQWDRIFKDPMTTAAAIDRLVHHATLLELACPSYRTDAARHRKEQDAAAATEAALT